MNWITFTEISGSTYVNKEGVREKRTYVHIPYYMDGETAQANRNTRLEKNIKKNYKQTYNHHPVYPLSTSTLGT